MLKQLLLIVQVFQPKHFTCPQWKKIGKVTFSPWNVRWPMTLTVMAFHWILSGWIWRPVGGRFTGWVRTIRETTSFQMEYIVESRITWVVSTFVFGEVFVQSQKGWTTYYIFVYKRYKGFQTRCYLLITTTSDVFGGTIFADINMYYSIYSGQRSRLRRR